MTKEVSLQDLNSVYHTQIDYDGFPLPIKIDIANVTSEDYMLAFSFTNQYKLKVVETQIKEENELDNIKLINIEDDKLTLSYEKLHYSYELDVLEQDKRLNYVMKFINITDKLFEENTKNLLEYLECEDIKTWLFSTGFNDEIYTELYRTISYWVEIMIVEFHANTKVALLLHNEEGKKINYNLARLKSCYETMGMYYFKENSDIKCFEELSYREQHLMQSYATKMNYIEIAINKDNKKTFEETKNGSKTANKKTSGYSRK